jgi:hypothetical protein
MIRFNSVGVLDEPCPCHTVEGHCQTGSRAWIELAWILDEPRQCHTAEGYCHTGSRVWVRCLLALDVI